jgi:hypothetical protein
MKVLSKLTIMKTLTLSFLLGSSVALKLNQCPVAAVSNNGAC